MDSEVQGRTGRNRTCTRLGQVDDAASNPPGGADTLSDSQAFT